MTNTCFVMRLWQTLCFVMRLWQTLCFVMRLWQTLCFVMRLWQTLYFVMRLWQTLCFVMRLWQTLCFVMRLRQTLCFFTKSNKYPSKPTTWLIFFSPTARRPQLAQELLWTSDEPDTGTPTWHHIKRTTARYLCPRWVSNSQSQQTDGHNSAPLPARSLGSAHRWFREPQKSCVLRLLIVR